MIGDAHQELHVRRGPRSDLTTVVAVHRTVAGRALGGCRLWQYSSDEDAVADAKRLSRAMTDKAAAAGIAVGGGKGVIAVPRDGQLSPTRRRAALRDFAELVESLDGRYYSGQDVGTSPADVSYMRRFTAHVGGRSRRSGGSGDPTAMTALGVDVSIRTALQHVFGTGDPRGRRIVLIGLGRVGSKLAARLARAGASLTVSDVDQSKRALTERLGADWVDPADAPWLEADLLSPCALGGLLTRDSVSKFRARAIAGAANNQLESNEVAETLQDAGILWAPDFIVNAGGLINIAAELDGYDPARVTQRVQAIARTLAAVFDRARRERTTTLAAAHSLIRERLEPAS